MKKVILLFLAITLVSCQEDVLKGLDDDKKDTTSEKIIGSWSHLQYADTVNTLEKVKQLPDDEYGITFRADGTMTEWKNAGWCGTPPITYGEFSGKWELVNDTLLRIETTYWGGDLLVEWKIESLENDMLTHSVITWEAEMP